MATQRRGGRENAAETPVAGLDAGGDTAAGPGAETRSEAAEAPRVPAEGEAVHEDDAGGTLTVEALDESGPPPAAWYVADRPLPVADELGGEAGRVAAFAEGDLVPADHVQRFGWHAHVSRPDGLPVDAPQPAAGQAADSEPAGETAPAETGEPAPLPPAQTEQPQLAGPVPQVAAPDQAPATAATGGEES